MGQPDDDAGPESIRDGRHPPAAATRPLLVLGLLIAAYVPAWSARYGYHRDELYFLAAGRHLSWGYPDQGLLTRCSPICWT